jgi:hypothetical protein
MHSSLRASALWIQTSKIVFRSYLNIFLFLYGYGWDLYEEQQIADDPYCVQQRARRTTMPASAS